MRREFWIDLNINEVLDLDSPREDNDVFVREVLAGEDDIIKVLVSALEQIKSKLNIYTLNCECDCVAEEALAAYNAWLNK